MIVVTAPTGRIGRHLVEDLLAADASLRLVVRNPERLDPEVRDRVEVVEGSHAEQEVVDAAFAGADEVFWLIPADPRARSVEAAYVDFSRPGIEALSRHGIQRVVGVSALGRGTPFADHAGPTTWSLAVDDLIAGTDVAYRALVMPAFMDNLLWQAELIRDQGMFTSPTAGDVRMPSCAVSDIAATAAGLLIDPSWTGAQEVPVLGPEDLSFEDMAKIMSEVLDRPIRFQRIPGEAFTARLVEAGTSGAMAQGMLDMLLAKDAGLDNGVVRTSRNSTPTSFRTWCAEVLKLAVQA